MKHALDNCSAFVTRIEEEKNIDNKKACTGNPGRL